MTDRTRDTSGAGGAGGRAGDEPGAYGAGQGAGAGMGAGAGAGSGGRGGRDRDVRDRNGVPIVVGDFVRAVYRGNRLVGYVEDVIVAPTPRVAFTDQDGNRQEADASNVERDTP